MLRSSLVQAVIGEIEDAPEHFQKVIYNFERYSLPWEVADTFHLWGRALLSCGQERRTAISAGSSSTKSVSHENDPLWEEIGMPVGTHVGTGNHLTQDGAALPCQSLTELRESVIHNDQDCIRSAQTVAEAGCFVLIEIMWFSSDARRILPPHNRWLN
jgi:hypothetical protein